jgi:hypothetical protein
MRNAHRGHRRGMRRMTDRMTGRIEWVREVPENRVGSKSKGPLYRRLATSWCVPAARLLRHHGKERHSPRHPTYQGET